MKTTLSKLASEGPHCYQRILSQLTSNPTFNDCQEPYAYRYLIHHLASHPFTDKLAEIFELLVQKGVNFNQLSLIGEGVLEIACQSDRVQTIKWLLKNTNAMFIKPSYTSPSYVSKKMATTCSFYGRPFSEINLCVMRAFNCRVTYEIFSTCLNKTHLYEDIIGIVASFAMFNKVDCILSWLYTQPHLDSEGNEWYRFSCPSEEIMNNPFFIQFCQKARLPVTF